MFTSLTLSAISVLHAISVAEVERLHPISSSEISVLLDRLVSGGFIRLIPGKTRGDLTSYCLIRPLEAVSMLNLLDALGESLNNVHSMDSDFYAQYGLAARKLGVINQVTRTCLSEISVSEIPVPRQPCPE